MTSRLPTFWASLGYAQASLPLTTCSWQLSSSGRAYQSSNLDGKEPSKAGPRIQSTIPRRRMRSVTPSSASLEFRLSGCRSSLFDEPPVCTSGSTRSAYVATRIAWYLPLLWERLVASATSAALFMRVQSVGWSPSATGTLMSLACSRITHLVLSVSDRSLGLGTSSTWRYPRAEDCR